MSFPQPEKSGKISLHVSLFYLSIVYTVFKGSTKDLFINDTDFLDLYRKLQAFS